MGTTHRLRESLRHHQPSGELRAHDDSGAFTRHNDVAAARTAPRAADLDGPNLERLAPFEEPNLELFALIEETQSHVVPSALADARRLLREREDRIAELEQQVSALRGELKGVKSSLGPGPHEVSTVPPAAFDVATVRPPAPLAVSASVPADALPSAPSEVLDHSAEEYPMLKRVTFSSATSPPQATEPPPSESGVPSSRRRNPRHALEIELEFTEDTHFYAGITQDLSEGGVFVATYRVLPVGTHLWLSFDLPDGARVRARGEVRWIREEHEGSLRPGMGVAFLELEAEALVAITKFCGARAPLYFEF
jgi:uncharacterized protein (TIGR02266 family)